MANFNSKDLVVLLLRMGAEECRASQVIMGGPGDCGTSEKNPGLTGENLGIVKAALTEALKQEIVEPKDIPSAQVCEEGLNSALRRIGKIKANLK